METESAGRRAHIYVTNGSTGQRIACPATDFAERVLDAGWFDQRGQDDRDRLYRLQKNVLRFGARDTRCAAAALGLRITSSDAEALPHAHTLKPTNHSVDRELGQATPGLRRWLAELMDQITPDQLTARELATIIDILMGAQGRLSAADHARAAVEAFIDQART